MKKQMMILAATCLAATLTVGTETQTNNVTFNAYSRFRATLGPAMTNDMLNVFGTVTIGANTTLEILTTEKTKSGAYTLIMAENGVSGKFTNVFCDGRADARYVRYTPTEVLYVIPARGAVFLIK